MSSVRNKIKGNIEDYILKPSKNKTYKINQF